MTDYSSSFALHQYGDILINQACEDVEISGKTIPKGYVNVTQMCKANNKKLSHWNSLKRSNDYIEALSMETGITASMLLIEIEGTTTNRDATMQGTFAHPEVAISIASWISAKFEVWANKAIRAVINNDFEALTPEAKKAQAELQKIWSQMRTGVKESFWFIGDAIKEYYDLNPRVEKYPGQNYSEVFDKLNLGLFGKKAKQIKSELSITSGLNRDNFGTNALKRIDMIQRIAEPQIKSGKTPVDSVSFALSVMMYNVTDYRE